MGSYWVLILLYLKNILYWPEDDRLRSKHVAVMWPDSTYYITLLKYCCVLTVHNTLYKFVTIQWDGLCQIVQFSARQNITFGRTPLDEWSARRRDLYLITHIIHNRERLMIPAGFEPITSASERPQTCPLDRAATGTGTTTTRVVQVTPGLLSL